MLSLYYSLSKKDCAGIFRSDTKILETGRLVLGSEVGNCSKSDFLKDLESVEEKKKKKKTSLVVILEVWGPC